MSETAEIRIDDHVFGPATAQVTVIEYGDYQCPYCARAHGALKQLREKLGDRMRLVYRHYPRQAPHPHAEMAAEAAEAAGAQDKFWEMHDKLYENQARLSPALIGELAGGVGLDQARFDDESGERRYRARVDRDAQQAILMGAKSTPTFLINGERYHGESDLASLEAAITGAMR